MGGVKIMLTIQSNSRQMPKSIKYTADDLYYDLIYGYVQEKSYLEEGERYIDARDCKFTVIGEKLDVTRQTASKYFKALIKLGLIKEQNEDKKKRYLVIELGRQDACLVPYDTLKILNDTLKQNVISIYIYILNRYIANSEKEFIFTNNQLAEYIGRAKDATWTHEKLANILKVLQLLGLIEIRSETGKDFKTIRYITKVNNVIKEC